MALESNNSENNKMNPNEKTEDLTDPIGKDSKGDPLELQSPPKTSEPQKTPKAKEEKKSSGWKSFLSLLLMVLILGSARWSLADHYKVPTGSMRPTVAIDDRILVDKRAYGVRLPFTEFNLLSFEGPQRGDVVILSSPETDITLLKRVVGIPGDNLAVRGGRLLLNGKPLQVEMGEESHTEHLGEVLHQIRLTRGGGPDFGPMTLAADKFLMMGDNRGESHDGRIFGLVDRGAIFGKAMGVYWRGGWFVWEDL